jgi:phosphate transport system substrate-binding protein
MKKIGVVLVVLIFSACSNTKEKQVTKELLIEGSESEKLLVQHLANHYNETNETTNIVVKGGGFEHGIEELKQGVSDIANSARIFTESDYKAFKSDSVKQAIVAVDAIAIIINPTLALPSLSIQQLSDIYSGKIKNWKEVGGPDLFITPVGRKEGSASRFYMEKRLNIEEYTYTQREFDKYEEIKDFVTKTKNAIGYVSLTYALDGNGTPYGDIWVLPMNIDGAAPHLPYDAEAVSYGTYPFTRPLFQYYVDGKNSEVQKFIQFELSDKGQELIKKFGFYPINDFHKQINKLKM